MHGTTDVVDESSAETAEPVRPGVKPRLRRLKPLDVPPAVSSRFRRACGLTMPYIVRISSSQSGSSAQPVLWDRASLIVGRGADCDLRLNHAEISRQHAYFQRIGDRIFCADLGSRTGTHWSDGATQAGWISPNEPVSMGPYSVTFEPAPHVLLSDSEEGEFIDGDDSSDLDPDLSLDDQITVNGESIYLDFVNAGPKIRRFHVGRDITLIGSGDGVKIRLSNPTVSSVHCAIVRTPMGLWVVDLLSADGTIVNGQVEPIAQLRSGDEFQVGRFLVAVHYGDLQTASPATSTRRPDTGRAEQDHTQLPSQLPSDVTDEPESTQLSALNQLARLAGNRQQTGGVSGPVAGLSEEFVLNIIRELGVMQQQALQHAQQSMRETLNQLSSAYQERIESLERQHAALREKLHGLAAERLSSDQLRPRLHDHTDDELVPETDPSVFEHPAFPPYMQAEQDVFDEIDPADREQWIRDQIKNVEAELNKTRRGWGKKLIDLLGY